MKAFTTQAILSSFRTRKDGSMGFSTSTPELTVEEKVALMGLEGTNVKLLIEPTDPDGISQAEGRVDVKTECQQKTPSQRLRSVLFVLFKHENPPNTTFATYYEDRMEKMIAHVKAKLPEQRRHEEEPF